MIVEHNFVTTLDEPAAYGAADEMLCIFRFDRQDDQHRGVQWHRRTPGRRRRRKGFLQHVRMDFDRGRVVVAASIDLKGTGERLEQALTVAFTLALERRLALGHALEESCSDVRRLESSIRRRNLVRMAVAWLLLVLLAGVLGSAVVVAVR